MRGGGGGGVGGDVPPYECFVALISSQSLDSPAVSSGSARGCLVRAVHLWEGFGCLSMRVCFRRAVIMEGLCCGHWSIDVASRALDELFEQFACFQAVCTLSQ